MTKNEWKKSIKKLIETKVENEDWRKRTKSRFVTDMKRENYVDETDKMTMRNIMKIRLNMLELKANFKGNHKTNTKCPACKVSEDSTEHLFECERIKEKIEARFDILREDIKSNKTDKMRMVESYAKKAMDARESLFRD